MSSANPAQPTTRTPKPTESRTSKLQRFVAYSVLAHLGGGIAWGIPAVIDRNAEQERIQEEQSLAEHFRKEEIKTKEHVREQQIEQTRRDIDEELRKSYEKLTANLSEEKRQELWEDVAEKILPESTNLAEALSNPDTPEQDLRTLEAELHRAMIEDLNEILNAATARDLADLFVDQVESQVAPDLAQWMEDELSKRVAEKMRQEAEKLIAAQREAEKKARDQTLASLKEVAAKTEAANTAVKQAGEQLAKADTSTQQADEQYAKADTAAKTEASTDADAATKATAKKEASAAKQNGDKATSEAKNQVAAASKQVDQAGARLNEADAKIDQAAAKSANLDAAAQAQVAAADAAITAAKEATAKAAEAVKARSDDANDAVAAAEVATAAAKTATSTAIDAVHGQTNREALAKAQIQAAAESAISAEVEKALTEELTNTTLPRLAGKLQEAFKKQLDASGMGDDELVAAVGKEVQERLTKSVPELAKAGNQAIDDQFGDSAEGAGAEQQGGGAEASAMQTALDKALAEGLAGIAANATKRVGELAANAGKDGALVSKAIKGMGGSEGDGAAMAQLRDTVGAMARGIGSGRLGAGTGSGLGIGGLRQAALGRSGGAQRNEKAYEEVTGQIAGREMIQGATWTREGAKGQASQADALIGAVPAQVVGKSLTATESSITNDQPYSPTFKSIAFTTVPYFNGTFRIDGNLAKWDAMPAIILKPEYGDNNAEQVMKLAWSNAGLFMYYKIADPNHQLDKAEVGNFWNADCAEVWVDAYNTKEKYRARHLGQQFWIWPAGSASDPTLTGGESVMAVKNGGYRPGAFRADQLERWATQTDEGWVMEARLPPALISDADLAAGRILGFNAYISTMGGTNWYWSAGKTVATYAQPDTWGDLLLAGSDAKIEVLSGVEDASKRVMMVGEPLRLRVTDGDMDLNPEARDKVMVSLKDGHDGQQIAVLEETGASTGIFEGAVTTALALDEAVPAVLGVYEGERVDIIYIDQARANGAREAQVATSVSFGAAVMAMGTTTKVPGE